MWDVLVIGGGHAGVEAAWAAARLGARTALVTLRLEAIARMSCNPAIGGLGKGQLVREIDALGGLMGLAIDRAGIQYRILNRSKGPAVWAPRAQADRALYARTVQDLLAACPNLDLIEGQIAGFETHRGRDGRHRLTGVRLADGRMLACRSVVLASGTFLRGLMHRGEQQTPGGRVGEPAAYTLSEALEALGLELGRLKTGTPPRVHAGSVDFDRLSPQPGDQPPVPFSFLTDRIDRPQVPCWITWTNARTHDLIRANLHRAPMYSGQIRSRGPRYCPSIEDKVVRFADRERHQVFLEPEGYESDWIYCNGISTSLPPDVQEELVHSIAGLERARIVQMGYAVEYDWVPTHQTLPTLECKRVAGLFLAGQVNGTSGYEEAAAQGLVAGINAVQALGGSEPLVLGRDQAYIGVMIDDLITRPPDEPYRMFTSRAEYRLHLRSDNADERLTPLGRRLGLVDDLRWERFTRKQELIASLEALLASGGADGVRWLDLLRRPDMTLASLPLPPDVRAVLGGFPRDVREQVEIRTRYAGYLERQERQIRRFQELESVQIPPGFDYQTVPGLRREAAEKLAAIGPVSLGQASRLSGVNPSDVFAVWVALKRRNGTRPAGRAARA